jgi:hypothetical protein
MLLARQRLGPRPFRGLGVAAADPEQGDQRVLPLIVHALDLLGDLIAAQVASGFLQGRGDLVIGCVAAKVGDIRPLLGGHGVEAQHQRLDLSVVKGKRGHGTLLINKRSGYRAGAPPRHDVDHGRGRGYFSSGPAWSR